MRQSFSYTKRFSQTDGKFKQYVSKLEEKKYLEMRRAWQTSYVRWNQPRTQILAANDVIYDACVAG